MVNDQDVFVGGWRDLPEAPEALDGIDRADAAAHMECELQVG